MPRDTLTGTRIRERRTALGLKQAALAEAAGISASYLNLIEHNRRRIGGKLLLSIARVLEVEPSALVEGAEAALLSALREAAAARPDLKAELERIDEFAGRFPGWAALLAESRKRIDALERTVETLTDRLTHDPHLAAALHDMLSTVTSIRSTAGILAETREIEPEWQDRFHRNINEDARRLAESSTALVRYLDSADSEANLTSPQEEVEAFLEENAYHFPALEEGALTADQVVEGTDALTTASSRNTIRQYLRRYARDAGRIPMATLMEFVRAKGFDPSGLARAFDAPLGSALHRLATLPPAAGLGPLGLVICDASGTMLFRKPLDEFPLPRFGAACALWPLFTALTRPAQPVYRIVEQSAREARRFETFSIAELTGGMRFGDVARIEAVMLFRPSFESGPVTTGHAPVPIGVSCRICVREGCSARREPSVLTEGL
ncbi:MAG: XRE family transcriptional regulator [Rhodobacteraceae bacterium]|nr:MAG: XRE family transcriptional regulator [Paracoccaceae bacterium]